MSKSTAHSLYHTPWETQGNILLSYTLIAHKLNVDYSNLNMESPKQKSLVIDTICTLFSGWPDRNNPRGSEHKSLLSQLLFTQIWYDDNKQIQNPTLLNTPTITNQSMKIRRRKYSPAVGSSDADPCLCWASGCEENWLCGHWVKVQPDLFFFFFFK